MIVVEGPDNTGKSTLIAKLGLSWPVKVSEGPTKSPEETIERVERYLAMPHQYVFDRHPIISGNIYGQMRGEPSINEEYEDQLLSLHPLLIFCTDDRAGHVVREEVDTPEHLAMIEEKAATIKKMYLDTFDRFARKARHSRHARKAMIAYWDTSTSFQFIQDLCETHINRTERDTRLHRLIEEAKTHVMTPEEELDAKVSWVFGQLQDCAPHITKEEIRAMMTARGV